MGREFKGFRQFIIALQIVLVVKRAHGTGPTVSESNERHHILIKSNQIPNLQ